MKEVPTYKLITFSVLVDRLRINASLARMALKKLAEDGKIRLISSHGSQMIYSTLTWPLFVGLAWLTSGAISTSNRGHRRVNQFPSAWNKTSAVKEQRFCCVPP